MTVTALDILKAAREYAADPEHRVFNPKSVYEKADGSRYLTRPLDDEAARGCVLGCQGIAARNLGVAKTEVERESCNVLADTVRDLYEGSWSMFEKAQETPETWDACYAAAIAKLEAEATS